MNRLRDFTPEDVAKIGCGLTVVMTSVGIGVCVKIVLSGLGII